MLDGNVLITGGAGYLGRGFFGRARKEGWSWKPTVLSRDDSKHAALQRRYPEVETVVGDVGLDSIEYLTALMRGFDIVIHAAAWKYVDRAEGAAFATVQTNIVGSANVARAAMKARVPRVVGVSTDKACVDYHARVQLADGSSRAIAELVRERSIRSVRTLSAEGVFAESPIAGWYKNQRAGRRMIAVSYEHGPHHGGHVQRALVTEDHPVLTVEGWCSAAKVDGVDLITSESAPNESQERLLIGTILGDAHVRRGRSGLQRYQAGSPSWNTVTANALAGLGASVRNHRNGGTTLMTRAAGWAARLRMEFYPDGWKAVPRTLVEQAFSPEMLAAWYMDDGTLARDRRHPAARPLARFATHGFIESDVHWLADLFTARGLPATVQRVAWHGHGPYYELRLTADASDRLFETIGRFIVSGMRHKVPEWALPYDAEAWALGASVPFIARGRAEEQTVPGRDVYCLDIKDTHNFAVAGVVLHNCQPVNNYGATKLMMERLFQEADRLGETTFNVVRYGNVIGSTGSVIPMFMAAVEEGKPVRLTDPAMTRFWMSVDEAIDLILYALRSPKGGEVIIPNCRALSMQDLVRVVLGYNEHGELPDDGRVEIIGIRPGEKRHEALMHKAESVRARREGTPPYIHLSPPDTPITNVAPWEITSDNPPGGQIGIGEMRVFIEQAAEV